MPISVLPTPPDFPPSKIHPKPTKAITQGNINYEPPDNSPTVDPTPSSLATDPITILREQAKSAVQSSAKGASALALLRSARTQYMLATNCENQGDLKGALVAFTKAAGLANMVFGTVEWGQNGQNAIKKELKDFMETDSTNLRSRMQAVEAKLRLLEKEKATSTSPNEGNSVSQKSGGSIADRMKALQNSGLSISTSNKRYSKDPHINGIPTSATLSAANGLSSPSNTLSTLNSASSSTSTSASSASASSTSLIYSHAFVSPSTLGPPSPGSSPSSSPTLPTRSFSTSSEYNTFNAQFPRIDELDEYDGRLDASGIISTNTGGSIRGQPPLASPIPAMPGTPQTPHAALRNFIVPVVERPSSTPSTPLHGSGGIWDSRPGSPTLIVNSKIPPVVPNKLSGLSTSRSLYGNFDDSAPLSSPPKSALLNLDSNTCTPKELYNYLLDHNVILLDVRERAEFEKGHIESGKGSQGVACVVCIEPNVLRRENVTSDTIEDSLSLAPTSEASTFNNRHKFELVVLYDRSSASFSSTPNPDMTTLLRAIWEREFKKTLKRMPMMLIGGYEAWVKEFGIGESRISSVSAMNGIYHGVTTNGASGSTSSPPSSVPPPLMSHSISSQGRNPFAPGGSLTSPVIAAPSISFSQPTGSHSSRSRAGTSPSRSASAGTGHRVNHSLDQGSPSTSSHSRPPAESTPSSSVSSRSGRATPTFSPTTPLSPQFSGIGAKAPKIVNGVTPITYPSFSSSSLSYSLPSASSSSATIRSPAPFESVNGINGIASPPPLPPQASINPSVSRRRTSDYVDQSQEAVSLNSRKPIDYPELSSTHPILRPPPPAAAGSLERQDNIKRYPTPPSSSPSGLNPLQPVPRLKSGEWPPRYWADSPIGTSGLKNMGNTCYMNAPIQCLSATVPFSRFFTGEYPFFALLSDFRRWFYELNLTDCIEVDLKTAINYMNKMNSQGQLTRAFSRLVHDIWHGDMPYITPNDFRRTLCSLNAQYIGTSQHDSQEFLSFLLDGIHEDTNRIMTRKPLTRTPQEEERLENLPQQIAGEYEWQVWRQSNDSIIVDFFQGMFRNQLRCMRCEKTSTTYNPFSILSLPVPARTGKIPLQNCLKAFFNVEVMEGDDAWDCPRCKTKRRATKTLSLARLPPVLVIHLKRFEANGRFSDKIDTFVDFPVKGLDLTELMPPPLPVGADQSLLHGGMVNGVLSRDDPRIQVGPYKYELYGVTNHYGNLSSGHYTAFVASRGGWLYCDDSSVKTVDAKQVVNQKAYVLFYKRVKA
ncbi:ubiquitin carboxyl-terminal hydrolase 4 [Lentinula aff. detonsa]|uniref:ubiquitinyl hydrolase 1 n=1 Tax=Lentinula aff. detonsa TaxID=2804958 RepID=A0AA38NHR6_9AGAR|nr:ubiquitin carboxyl-terminal hydrolase 4 [Lentinula aff. detonsa]